MTNTNTELRVALVSNNAQLIKSVEGKLLDKKGRVKVQAELEAISERENITELNDFEVVIYDLDFVANDLQRATIDMLEIKTANPDIPLILIGNRSDLSKAMASERVTPLVARTLNKPVLSAQLLIAIGIVSPKLDENAMMLDAASQRSKLLMPAAIAGVLAIAVAMTFFFKSDDQPSTPLSSSEFEPEQIAGGAQNSSELISEQDSEVKRIYALAQDALNENRLILPEGNNALLFLNQVLEITPYNQAAYSSKQELLKKLRTSFDSSIALGDIGYVTKVAEVLQQDDPFNKQNRKLTSALRDIARLQNIDHDQLAQESRSDDPNQQTGAVAEPTSSKLTIAATERPDGRSELISAQSLEKEQRALASIYASIDAGNLLPPGADNAYALLLESTTNQTISETELSAAKSKLANQLIQTAKQDVRDSQLNKANKSIRYIRSLDGGHAELPELQAMIKGKRDSLRAEENRIAATASEPTIAVANNSTANSIENRSSGLASFKVLKRVEPEYPKRAYNFDIEGWVEVEYQVNELGKAVNVKVLQAQPKRIFNKSAIKAIKAWTFEPSTDLATGKPVMSKISSSKFNFALDS